jgi:MFS family permease
VPAAARTAFGQAGAAGFAGFALLGLFTAVSPSVLALLGHHNTALTGLVVFAVFAASAGGQLISAALPTRPALLAGTAILILGLVLLAISLAASSLLLLLVAGVLGGGGQGLSFRAALGLLTEISPAEQRSGVASSFFAVVYVGISLPVVGVGAGTQAYGLVRSGEIFAGLLAVLALLALTGLVLRRP